jgi:hypothetical protein
MYFRHWKPPGVSERMWSVNLDASISGEYQTLGELSGQPSEKLGALATSMGAPTTSLGARTTSLGTPGSAGDKPGSAGDQSGTSAKCISVQKPHAFLLDTPVDLTSASKYFQMLPGPPGAM